MFKDIFIAYKVVNLTQKVKKYFFIGHSSKQDSIPVGCIPPTWKPYVVQFWLPPSDVAGGKGRSPTEQV